MELNDYPISHDRLFQELLEGFFADFLELVVPHLSRKLHLDRVDFIREKGFTAPPEGRLLIRDLLARVRTRAPPPASVDFHVELEREFRRAMGLRMRRYYHQRSAQRPHRVLVSIVLYLTGGPRGITRQCLEEKLWEEDIDRFWYYSFGLEKSLAEEWTDRPQPLAPALAALMRSETWSLAEQKLHCLKAIARADVDEERRFLLVNLVETYLNLTGPEAERYAELVALEDNEEILDMQLTWAGRIQKENYELGMRDGIEQGRAQGIEHGRLIEARHLALDLFQKRFGPLPAKIAHRIESMKRIEIQQLTERLLEAETLDDLALD